LIVIRFVLRFLIVPLGVAVALCVSAMVVLAAHWTRIEALASDPAVGEHILLGLFLVGPIFALALSIIVATMLIPATIGLLVAETFAIRSWVFHVANGGFSVWLGWLMLDEARRNDELFAASPILVGAGIAAGFAYWAVAGWNAGFWKPVFAPAQAPRLAQQNASPERERR
jgi:hypothetical protein